MLKGPKTLIKGAKDFSVTINNTTVNGDLRIDNNGVYVNGKRLEESDNLLNNPKIEIHVKGNVDTVTTRQGDVNVIGDVGNVTTSQGNVELEGSVNGDVSTGQGDVTVKGNIYGSSKTGWGDIKIES